MNLVAKACHFSNYGFYYWNDKNKLIKISKKEVEKMLNFYSHSFNKQNNLSRKEQENLTYKLFKTSIIGLDKKAKTSKFLNFDEINKLFYDILHTNFSDFDEILYFYSDHGLLLESNFNHSKKPQCLEGKSYDNLYSLLKNIDHIKRINKVLKYQKENKINDYSAVIKALNDEIKKVEPKIVVDSKGTITEEKHSKNLMNAVYYFLIDSLKKSRKVKECKYCGREFIATNGNELYCPPEEGYSRSQCENDYNYRKNTWPNKIKSGKYNIEEAAAKITWRNKNGDLEKGISVEKMKELLNDSN